MTQYAPKTWNRGDTITAAKLNEIELAAAAAAVKVDSDAAYEAKGAAAAAQASAVQRANHTGTQLASTISDLKSATVPQFQAATAYTAGQYILNPQGQIVSALATFTSAATYSSADWQLLTGTIYPAQRPMVPPSKVITRFPSGHGWTGGTSDDTAVKLFTDRTYKVVTNGTGASMYISSPTFAAQDWSTSIMRFYVLIADLTKLATLQVYVTMGSGNVMSGVWQANIISNEWAIITMNRSQFATASGTPNWAGVTQVQFRFQDNKNSGGATTIWLGGFELLPDQAATYPNGVFVLECDDGYASQLTQLRPVTDALGIPVTMNLIISRIASGTAGITLADLRSLQNYSGWSMSCHANSQAFHDTAGAGATAVTAHADFAAEKQWLHDNGFHSGADHYALCPGTGSPVPEGQVMDQLRADFSSVRANSGFYETVIPGDRHKLRSILFSGNTNANLQSNIDAIAGAGGMLIFTVHEVLAGSTNGTASTLPAIAAANLTTILQYAASKGMVFRTRADAMALR